MQERMLKLHLNEANGGQNHSRGGCSKLKMIKRVETQQQAAEIKVMEQSDCAFSRGVALRVTRGDVFLLSTFVQRMTQLPFAVD